MYHFLAKPPLFKHSRHKFPIIHRQFKSSPDHYVTYIDIYGQNHNLQSGKILHAYLIVTGLTHSSYLSSKLITFYSQCKQIQDARKVFDQIPEPNISRWIVLIGAYSRQGFYQETIQAFAELQRNGLKLDKFILPSTLRACANLEDRLTGEKIHGAIVRSFVEADAFVDSSLIYMYSKCGRVDKARLVFNRMLYKDLVAWNSMVSGYVLQECVREALGLVDEMRLVGMKPNLVTWNALIAGFSQVGDDAMALKLFQMMQADRVKPDVVSWTSILSGFVRNSQNSKAFSVFKQMMATGIRPSSFTISSLLSGCGTVADLKCGREIHGYALVSGVEEDIFVRSSLVDMYAKSGSIVEAKNLFHKMHERNVVAWNSMIFGYANHGYCNEAFELLDQMLKNEKVKPDHLTFTAALTACSHAGMTAFAWNLFHIMQKKYKIEPRLEHYACMVDILSRAGELNEAYDLIVTMPISPDSFVWGALLGACRNHGNVELAEIAAKNLYELEPVGAGSRLLMSNLYADVGKWEDAEKLKRMMKRKKFRRSKGGSWIELV